jgi:hypothetical protein
MNSLQPQTPRQVAVFASGRVISVPTRLRPIRRTLKKSRTTSLDKETP